MTLENQVTSLELSKKLKELGVKQESYFVWHSDGYDALFRLLENDEMKYPLGCKRFSAYTVAELGEMLPQGFHENKQFKLLTCLKKDTIENRKCIIQWAYFYQDPTSDKAVDQEPEFPFYDENEANARAKILIYLIENKITKP